ncbi:MAG: lysophospholipid acyltransferase family protein [Sphingomonadales bacterium]
MASPSERIPEASGLVPETVARGTRIGWRAGRVALLVALMTIVALPFQLLAIRYRWPLRATLPVYYHRIALWLIGVRVRVVGRRAPGRAVLFAANHVSWLDIPVLGSLIPGCFIAKREVGEWAGFGTLARLQRTIFVDRERRRRASDQNEEIGARLVDGDDLILFAEGTSSAGDRVLPFKTALFGVAERLATPGPDAIYDDAIYDDGGGNEGAQSGLTVQPVTIAYTAINGIPLARATRPRIGWYGDMSMMPHFTDLLGLGRIAVEVHFHEPVNSRDYASRKTLAAHCEREVRRGLVTGIRRSARNAAVSGGRGRGGGRRRFSRRHASDIRKP